MFTDWKGYSRVMEEQFYRKMSHCHMCIGNCKETFDKTSEGHDKQHLLFDWIAGTIEYSNVDADSIIQLYLLAMTYSICESRQENLRDMCPVAKTPIPSWMLTESENESGDDSIDVKICLQSEQNTFLLL
ncbi:unnamed protein product [Caenorhabditis nigoni]